MRRSDRELKTREEIIGVMKRCDVCRLALNNDGYPYILPLNFGLQTTDREIVLYFHGAAQGQKYELMAADNRAGFEMDCCHRLISDETKGYCTMEYESVIGRGKLEIVPESEKEDALCHIVQHYHEEPFAFNRAAMPRTTVFRLTVEEITGKRRVKRDD